VAGPGLREVLQLEQPPNGAEEAARSLHRLHGEVRAREVADEERVAGHGEPRLVCAAAVGDEIGHVLRAVARRRERCDLDPSDGHGVAVRQRNVLVLDARFGRDVDPRARGGGQTPVAGDVVGVVVRLEDVRDREVVLLGEREVVRDLPFRVDDGGLAPVREDVGRAAEILVQHLPEEHAGGSYAPPPGPHGVS
jgi:hypothetical protein